MFYVYQVAVLGNIMCKEIESLYDLLGYVALDKEKIYFPKLMFLQVAWA